MEPKINFEREMLLKALRYNRILERRVSDNDIKEILEQSKDYVTEYLNKIPPNLREKVIYSGAEHKGELKLPNLTILLNLLAGDTYILGSTFGHQHNNPCDNRDFQEIYQFLGYGAMLLRNEQGTTFYVLKPNEKILTGTRDNMTLFNLGTEALITIDYANPEKNSAHKIQEKSKGPFMLVKYKSEREKPEITFKMNEKYFPSSQQNLSIQVPAYLGEPLYKELKHNSEYEEKFKEFGIQLSFEGNIPEDLKKEFSPNLLDLVLSRNRTLLSKLGMQ